MKKESLLAFAIMSSPLERAEMANHIRQRALDIGMVDVLFSEFPPQTEPEPEAPSAAEIKTWAESVRQPKGGEFANRGLRNRLVFEVEKLGEFLATLESNVFPKR